MKRLLTLFMTILALASLPESSNADSFYMLGLNSGNWDVGSATDTYKFTQSTSPATTYTYSYTPTTSGDVYFRVGGKDANGVAYGNDLAAQSNNDVLTATAYTIAWNKSNAWKLTVTAGTTYLFTLDNSNASSPTLKYEIVTTPTTGSNKKGYYIFGSSYDTSSPTSATKLHYKMKKMPESANEYYIDLFAAEVGNGLIAQNYSDGNNNGNNTSYYPSMNGTTFQLGYVSADNGDVTKYYPSAAATLTTSDFTSLSTSSNANWTLNTNGGMYRFIVKTDASGNPISWKCISKPLTTVIYKLGASNDWTTTDCFYCTRTSTDGTYNDNYFGSASFTQNEEFAFMIANIWLKKNYSHVATDKNMGANGSSNLIFNYATGVYLAEVNLTRTDYQLDNPGAGNVTVPFTVQLIGSALTPSGITSDTFSEWAVDQRRQLTYDSDESCWKGDFRFHNSHKMRFLLNNVLATNWGEDSNTPGNGGDTDFNNKVAYNTAATDGTNIAFNPPTGNYTIRFYIQAQDGTPVSSVSDAYYHYTLTLNVVVNPVNNELLRTYSNTIDLVPASSDCHIFAAQKFTEATITDNIVTGKVNLYELNYIPANVGVVLYAGAGSAATTFTFNPATADNVTNYTASKDDHKYYWKNYDSHSTESWNNDLVAVINGTSVPGTITDASGNITARNFALNHYYATKDYASKGTGDDYVSFFRLTADGAIGANKAYLQLTPTDGMNGNGQLLNKGTDDTVAFSKAGLWFEGIDEDTPTGITEVNRTVQNPDPAYYNLQGMKVDTPVKGMYIHNGKKYIVK